MEKPRISIGEVAASLCCWSTFTETLPSFREKAPSVTRDPLNLASACGGNAKEYHFGDAFTMTLAIGQRERGSPRSGEDEPSFYSQRYAQTFQIADKVWSRIRG